MAKPAVRIGAVRVAFAAGLILLVLRAGEVQLLQGRRYAAEARRTRTRQLELPARRGTIYDRTGIPLAFDQEVYRVNVTPAELVDRREAVELLTRHLGVSRRYVTRQLERRYAWFRGPFTASQVAPLQTVRGVYATGEPQRMHPQPMLAEGVLGRPGTADRPGDGMERVMDSVLRGQPGHAVVLRDQFGRQYESPGRLNQFPVPGSDVYLTLDADLQDLVEQALRSAVDQYRAIGGDVVVMNPRTGELLAVASWQRDEHRPSSPFTSAFQPGSTAKLFAAAALLTDALVSERDSVWGEGGAYRLGSRVVHDDHREGWMTLRRVISRSSNVGIVKFAARLRPERQYVMLRDFGFGSPTGVEYPTESGGTLRRPVQWSSTSAASLAMGYELAVTMLQLTQAYAAIANGGVLMTPQLVDRVYRPDGRLVYQRRPRPVRRVVPPHVATELREMLRGVVEEGGTGETAAMTSYEVAGKTGTARRVVNGRYVPGSTTATFVSLVPADDPQLVMTVKLDDPELVYSRATAAPLTRLMLEQLRAARTGVIERARIAARTPAPASTPAVRPGAVPYVVQWPLPPDTSVAGTTSVPALRHWSLRRAVGELHRRGLRVRVVGWGAVSSVDPAPGTTLPTGTLVTIHGTEREPPRSGSR